LIIIYFWPQRPSHYNTPTFLSPGVRNTYFYLAHSCSKQRSYSLRDGELGSKLITKQCRGATAHGVFIKRVRQLGIYLTDTSPPGTGRFLTHKYIPCLLPFFPLAEVDFS